jgi:hypothetical protein
MSSLFETIQCLMTELRSDKKNFENFEIDSGFIKKYQAITGNTQVFDFWYDRFEEIKTEVAKVQSKANEYEEIVNRIKKDMQKQFDNCHICAGDLTNALKDFKNYSISQLRANIDFLCSKTTVMLLYKTADGKFPEIYSDFNDFRKAIYNKQEEFNKKYEPQKFVIKNLFFDDNISIDCITRDFPISIRFSQNALL